MTWNGMPCSVFKKQVEQNYSCIVGRFALDGDPGDYLFKDRIKLFLISNRYYTLYFILLKLLGYKK